MTTIGETTNYREYKIPWPPAVVSSYALESSAPHIAAAELSMYVRGLITKDNLESAQTVEYLYLETLREILHRENRVTSNPQECCMPFVDVALDALASAVLEIIASGSKNLSPAVDRLHTTLRKATPNDDDGPVVRAYYRHYVNRLVLFCLTQYADLDIGSGRYFHSLAQRNLYFSNTAYTCESAISTMGILPAKYHIKGAILKEAIDRSRRVADKIKDMPFVSASPFPKMVRKIILCGTENSSDSAKEDKNTITLNGDYPPRNVIFRIQKIEQDIGVRLSSMSRDLVEVATYVFAGDVLVRRSARWRRSLNFVIPVRNVRRWRNIAEDLSMITSFISGDHVSFKFTQRQAEQKEKAFDSEPISGDCVCLLSGGLDSFAGSLELLQRGRHPVLIGHFKQSHVATRQKLVTDALKRLFDTENKKLTALRLDVGLASGRAQYGLKGKLENTQRLRSFLFLSLATAVADGLGLREIYIPENGILAFNVPLAACRTGSRSTRSAHPRFLWYFEKIVNQLYDRQFKVRNPLIFKTKAEVLGIFRGTRVEGDLIQSISCSRYSYGVMMDKRRGKRHCTHCGTCLACLIRRAAMIRAGLDSQDGEYIIHPFKESVSLKDEEWLSLLHLLDFCRAISNTSDDQKILLRHPQLVLPNQYFPDTAEGSIGMLEAARMYRRFANEIIEVVREMAEGGEEAALLLLKICGLADDK